MEAGTGIEPVFTDLQSRSWHQEINGVGRKTYQDKSGTGRERDTGPECTLTAEDIRFRMQLARELAEAIGEAHPDDAVQIMSAALADLTHGGQRPDFFLNAEEEVRWWASFEPPEVLVATLSAVLDNLGNRAMHLDTRKRLFWLLWQGFDAATRAAFLARIGGVQ